MADVPARALSLQHPQPSKQLPPQPRPISLLLEHKAPGQKAPALISLPMAPHETISSLKLRAQSSAQFTSDHVLVLGDRQLLDHETVGQLAHSVQPGGASPGYLHIVVRLKDVESVRLTSNLQRSLDWDISKGLSFLNGRGNDAPRAMPRSRSALTNMLTDGAIKRASSASSLASSSSHQQSLSRSSSISDCIVHLIVQKPYRLGWKHLPGADRVELSISADTTAGEVAAELEKLDDLPVGNHRLSYNGRVLASHQSLASYGIGTNALLELAPLDLIPDDGQSKGRTVRIKREGSGRCLIKGEEKGSPPLSSPAHALFRGWQAAQAGLASGLVPQLTPSSSGGTYFCKGSDGNKVAVLKPADEEPYGVNNPRNHTGSSPDGHGLRKGVQPGEGAIREVAAFLLDHKGFAGVPPTALVTCKASQIPSMSSPPHAAPPLPPWTPQGSALEAVRRGLPPRDSFRDSTRDSSPKAIRRSAGPVLTAKQSAAATTSQSAAAAERYGEKLSSLQMFVTADTDCEEQSPSSFPVHQVHKIAQLDMRLANADRNASNILAKRDGPKSWTLIPIDHGYCLPSSFQDISFEWMNWPQALVPFSQETRQYIAAIDCEADLALLSTHGLHLRSDCQRVARATTLVLQIGAARNLTPFVIASVMCREAFMKSPLEKLHMRARQLSRGMASLSLASDAAASASAAEHEDAYFHHLRELLEEYFDDIASEDTPSEESSS